MEKFGVIAHELSFSTMFSLFHSLPLRNEKHTHKKKGFYGLKSGFFLRMTNPSMIGVSGTYSSAASSALSPNASRTGVVWVWKPVIVFGFPAWPTTSTA
jgi:hypothetical protein